MARFRLLFVLLIGFCLAEGTSAGIFFKRKQPSPTRLQELIGILKTDTNESKRADAAAELAGYDGKAHPEIVPVLTEALMRDPSASVHLQAVEALGKIRPVSQEAGQALEYALANDSSTRVRLQARATLLQYRLAGYRSAGGEGPKLAPAPAPPLNNREPPLADPAPERVTPPPYAPAPPQPTFVPPNPPAPPVLVAPQPASRYVPLPGGVRPLAPPVRPVPPTVVPVPTAEPALAPVPVAPAAQPTLVPAQPPVLEAPPASAPPSGDGPSLNAPK
jgi:hypothetical protein